MSSVERPMLRLIRPLAPCLDAHPPRLENHYPLRPRCSFIQFPAWLQFTLVACILSMMLLTVAPVATRMNVPAGGTGPVFPWITLRVLALHRPDVLMMLIEANEAQALELYPLLMLSETLHSWIAWWNLMAALVMKTIVYMGRGV